MTLSVFVLPGFPVAVAKKLTWWVNLASARVLDFSVRLLLLSSFASPSRRLKVAVVLSNLLLWPINLTVNGCTVTACLSHIQPDDHWLWPSGSNVTSSVNMSRAVTPVRQSPKPFQHRFSPGPIEERLRISFSFAMLKVETLSCYAVKTPWSYL